MKDEIAAAAVRSAPPVTVSGVSWLTGMTINDWVGIATLLYIALQAVFLLRNELRKRGRK